jgi:hypothetical protein
MATFDRHSPVHARLPVASHLRSPTITNDDIPALINYTATNTEKCRSPVHNPSWPFKAFGGCKPDDHKQHLVSATSSAPVAVAAGFPRPSMASTRLPTPSCPPRSSSPLQPLPKRSSGMRKGQGQGQGHEQQRLLRTFQDPFTTRVAVAHERQRQRGKPNVAALSPVAETSRAPRALGTLFEVDSTK